MNNNLKDICYIEALDKSIGNIGINITNGKVEIILPRCYDLSSDDNHIREDIFTLINTLNTYKYRVDSIAYLEDEKSILDGLGENLPVNNILWLLNDYIQHGIFKETTINYKKSKLGKIDWTKTIKSMPVYYSDSNFVYLDFIVKNKLYDENYLLTVIHQYCICECIDIFGWLYNVLPPLEKPFLNTSIRECLNFLHLELLKTNNDYKKHLITNLIEFIEGSGNSLSSDKFKSFSISTFNNVWEDMLRVIFGNDDEKKHYSRAQWHLSSNTKPYDCKPLKPDIILKDKNNLYVIDAKYFKYGLTFLEKDLPGSSDISKQFNYSSYIANKNGVDENMVQDIFLIPYNSNSKDLFKYIGYATIDSHPGRKIHSLLVDIKTIMKLYTNKCNYDKYKVELLKKIDEIRK